MDLEIKTTTEGVTLTQNGVSIFVDREHALHLSREIDSIWYRDDVLWALTQEPESYLDASEYDLERIKTDVKEGRGDEIVEAVLDYYEDERYDHDSGSDEVRDWTECMQTAFDKCLEDGDCVFAAYAIEEPGAGIS